MNKVILNVVFILIALFFPLYAVSASADKHQVVIGILAFRSKQDTLNEWIPLTHYLNKQIPSRTFTIRPLSYKEFNDAVAKKELDFAFTNPEHYVYFSVKYNATRIATLIRANVGGNELKEFGGVIIARSDRKDITGWEDLKNKNIAAVDQLSLGGYLAQSSLLLTKGIDVTHDDRVIFTDMPHDKVVYIVESGSADAGFIRTGVLEKMAKEGKVNRDDFKIINPQKIANFPQALSTQLFPEWPFVAFKETDPELANQVAIALLSLPRGSEIPKTAGYYGWNIPLAYEGIRALMEDMRVTPFDKAPVFTINDVIRKYALMIIISLGVMIAILLFFARRLRKLTITLKSESQALEEQIAIREEAQKYLRRIASVFHNSREGIVITDANKIIIDVNEAFCTLTEYTRDDVIGQKPLILRSGRHSQFFYALMDQALERDGSWRGEIWNKKKGGQEYAEFLRIDAVRNITGEIENFIGIFSDITEHKKQEEQLHRLVNYDPLTNLPNRHMYMILAEQMLAFSKRKGSKAIVAFLDLDGFKQVNDGYGHAMGDRILKQAGARLAQQLRQSDIIARIGGDEFVILLSDISIEAAHELLMRILDALKEPIEVDGITINIGVSIGATLFPDDCEEIDILIRHADAAMYRSKEMGRNRITYYNFEAF
ncbi:MAG: PhnD/SsuA/transferrin family substrate-binding protein [Sulfuricurvum sp.]|uniref:PhnD/SsuA/transferrin family substrate-binding protein n=1 Tax=Sulfuricurvum sp. TaxID=2025608 RepID=UPI00260EADFB|nr:PhnD/SsuA/transferrin family substrate-binding protein [Sulfuricurvum sp.]MDD5160964.1 PhnD/SsuA/transferrin family substrate-binding protein [Sulfuricurvum sp.]